MIFHLTLAQQYLVRSAGALLVLAALLKSFYNDYWLFSSQSLTYSVAVTEALLGCALIVFSQSAALRAASGLLFLSIGIIAGGLWFKGIESCGCFGAVSPSPIVMMLVDFGIAFTLLPQLAIGISWRHFPLRWIVSVGSIAAIASASLLFAIGAPSNSTSQRAVVAPDAWFGRKFPLLSELDIGDHLRQSRWLVLFVREDCPYCGELLSRARMLKNERTKSGEFRLAVVRVAVSPASPTELSLLDFDLIGHLPVSTSYYLPTPAAIELQDGIVATVFDNAELHLE